MVSVKAQPINNTNQKKNTVLHIGCFGLVAQSGVFRPFSLVPACVLTNSCIPAARVIFRSVCPRTAGLSLPPTSLRMAVVISCCFLNAHCYFLVSCGCSLFFPRVLQMVTVILEWLLLFPVVSRCTLDAACYFLVRSAWSFIFLGVLWMVAVVSLCAVDGHCYFLVYSGWSLLFPIAPRMVTVIFWCPLDGHYYFWFVHKQHMSHRGKHKATH